FPGRFVLLKKPGDNDFMAWYPAIQQQYGLAPFVTIEKPDPYVMVNRYIRDDRSEFFFFVNAHLHREHRTRIAFPKAVTSGKYAWVWDMTDGNRYRIDLDRNGAFALYLGPAESRLIVFDREEKGARWNPLPPEGKNSRTLEGWDVELRHSCENSTQKTHFFVLEDLKLTQYIDFTGTVIYTKTFHVDRPQDTVLNLGKVWGLSEVRLNGEDCGLAWFGNRLYDLSGKLKAGENKLEVKVVTTMGNYVQTLTENPIGQKWTNRPGRAPQPKQSMGLGGPVTLYEKA
ncbi:MAG: glycoside hydrolase family 2, partial [Tannerella sp.]|nr:glycoside hydrolase family 2 [Tannerella sp.]